LIDISVQLLWKDQFEFAGYYIAKELGFYSEVGLNPELKEFDFGIDIVDEVVSGRSDFGIGYSSIIIEKAKGREIRGISATFQSSPAVLITKKRHDIKTISDLRGKILNISYDEVSYSGIRAMLQSNGIDFSGIKNVKNNYDLNLFIEDKIDGYFAYRSNEPFILKERGIDTSIWSPVDYGFDFYDDILFTSQKLINSSPEVVKNFYEATMKGWDYAFSNIEESVDIIYHKYNSQNKSKEALLFEAKELKKLAKIGEVPFGEILEKNLELIEGIYRVFGFISTPQSASKDFIYRVDSVSLTEKEEKYLRDLGEISYCINPNWMPYEKFENGKHFGLSKEYIDLFAEKLNVYFKLYETNSLGESLEALRDGKCLLIPILLNGGMERNNIIMTNEYINFPLVIATKSREIFITNLKDVKNKKIGVLRDETLYKLISKDYPKLDLVYFDNYKNALNATLKGEIYGTIGSLLAIGYEVNKDFSGLISITGKLDLKYNFSVGVSEKEPILKQIMCKTINSFGEELKQKAINSLINIRISHENELDFSTFLKVLASLIVIIFILVYRNIILKKLRIKSELEKEETEKIFSAISLPIFIASVKERKIKFINSYAKMQFEDYGNDLINESVDLIYKSDREREKITSSFNRFNRVDNLELQFLTVTGGVFYGLLSLVKITYLGEESFLGVISVIDKQKRKEIFLSKQKNQLESILSASLSPMVIFGKERGDIKYINHATKIEFEDDHETLIGMNISNIYWRDVGDQSNLFKNINRIDRVENLEIEFQTLQGKKFYGLISIIEIEYFGEPSFLGNISKINQQIERQKILQEEKKLITDSIKYASKIQEKLLSSADDLNWFFRENFMIWEPRDIVGGDIYFIETINNNEILIFLIDGTGHGVPGAFLTVLIKVIERNILSSIRAGVLEASETAKMMAIFDSELRAILKQQDDDLSSSDGFDGGVIYYNRKKRIINFSGASTTLRYIENGELKYLKGDRGSVGYKNRGRGLFFSQQSLKVDGTLSIYISTDGFIDQNGGEKGFPFGKKRLDNLILKNHLKPFIQQREIFLQELNSYQGDFERQDDVTMIAFKI
jgi:ABC-type nitrate/sulfonate/bicarbonate transport system substrate-binding protein/serine phosphatase RsbU (regulator of sigma subunit)